uniref:hypothetical protein n=1 Tax=Candidatus Thiodubiliella endoseptemdiera TaxID=2738886 RepID=UPI0034DDF359
MNKEDELLNKIIKEKIPNSSVEEKELAREQLGDFIDICSRVVVDEITGENKKDLNK